MATPRKENPKPKLGNAPWIPSEEEIKKVYDLAAQGMTQAQISDCLGIHRVTLWNKAGQYPNLDSALKEGQAAGIARVTKALLNNIDIGNPTAQLFYLKCRAGWKETQVIEHDGNVNITSLTTEELEALAKG